MKAREDISCPFCDERGFDLEGLWTHVQTPGWCSAGEELDAARHRTRQRAVESATAAMKKRRAMLSEEGE